MDAQDFRDLARVFEAGEIQMAGWMNPAAPVLAAALLAMAGECRQIAGNREEDALGLS